MFFTKHRGRTIGLLTIASSLFSASNLKHRSVLPSLTQRNESRMFHTVALATFLGLRNQALWAGTCFSSLTRELMEKFINRPENVLEGCSPPRSLDK